MKVANNLVKAAGFKSISDSSYIKKCDINTNIDKEILDELKNQYNYLVKSKINDGIKTTQDLLTLIRRVLKTHEKSLFYKRFNHKGKTSFLYKII